MSYRIEITADTLAELAGKAASLAAKLNASDQGIWWEQTDAPQKLKKHLEREAAEAAPVDPTPTPPAPVAETPAPSAPTLDYKTEVAPLVLKLVEKRGKPAAQNVLDQFGAAKASDIPAERWVELVAMIKAEMGK